MKKITLLLLFMSSLVFAQRVEPTFTISNKSDYQINGEQALTFSPGQVVSYTINFTLGSTDTVDDVNNFVLFGVQDEAMTDVDPATGTWANETIDGGNDFVYAASGDYTIPASTELSSENANLTYRILAYLAYTPNGGTTIYGGENASDSPLVYIRSTAEITALSTTDFTKEIALTMYPNPVENTINLKGQNLPETYKITNTLGKIVKQGNFEGSIDASALSTGMYFLVYDNKTFTKFLKK
ncbi:T9SS type A sorting domain-containing protein [Polaribacter sp. Z014]|uniref:T9SS type A sorting domain-containing protein n=1 Tax=Polaribacter sp. Z014 TaxID=2927126 RepID=UPI0020222B4F|nr:T9SS type A sorting domain-containing protein [Polaribacter sp. Z014]MCL7764946.1 T9SS type A sorting domain-containing protein [Polaribacter sp. Z014]